MIRPPIHIVVACDERLGIGKEGQMPWYLPADLKHFKHITTAAGPDKKNVVVMGRKTWESIPDNFRPLVGRVNCVLTRSLNFSVPKGVLTFASFLAFWDWLAKTEDRIEKVFIIGGAQIFAQVLKEGLVSRIYFTHIHAQFDCDTFFPDFYQDFEKSDESELFRHKELQYQFEVYQVK